MSNHQLYFHHIATVSEVKRGLEAWAEVYFICLGFDGFPDGKTKEYVNEIPTSFSHSDAQADTVIQAGLDLLRNNRELKS